MIGLHEEDDLHFSVSHFSVSLDTLTNFTYTFLPMGKLPSPKECLWTTIGTGRLSAQIEGKVYDVEGG